MTLPLFEQIFDGPPAPTGKPLTGEDLKRSGMESVKRHIPLWYREAFLKAVADFPQGRMFTVEDIRAIVGDPPDVHYNAMGSLVLLMAQRKLARKTGLYVKAKRPHMNATEIAQWERL